MGYNRHSMIFECGLKMDNQTFALYRKLLFLSVIEASRGVAQTSERPDGVSERAWNRWEKGEAPIPQEVIDNLQKLITQREAVLNHIKKQVDNGEKVIIHLNQPDIIQAKISQSIAAQAAAWGAEIEYK